MALDLHRFFVDDFEPGPDEVVTVACDLPSPTAPDHPAWGERRAMAEEWRPAFAELGVAVCVDRVAIKPGAPLVFGTGGRTLVFGLQ